MTNRSCKFALCLLLTASAALQAQSLSFGVIGGSNLTRDFDAYTEYYAGDIFNPAPDLFSVYSDTHGSIFGPTFEVRFGRGLSVEADALHRNLRLKGNLMLSPPSGPTQYAFEESVTTWEWPVLLKYRVPVGRVTPFIEAGPSFRTRKNPGSTEPSQIGGTLGAGTEFRMGRLRIAPTLRYTRWQYDGPYPRRATKRDQLELLAGVSYDVSPAQWKLGGRKLRFGVIGGAPFTGGFPESDIDEKQGYAAGLQAEYQVRDRLSVGVNGIYRPLRGSSVSTYGDITSRNDFAVLTWEFPVLASYTFGNSGWRPFVEAGPSFRLTGNLNNYNPSHSGVTAGFGVEKVVRGIKIAPRVRYTRWRDDSLRYLWMSATRQNELEFLAGVSF